MGEKDGHEYKDYRYGDELEEIDTIRERVRGVEGLLAIAMSDLRKENIDDSKERVEHALEHLQRVRKALQNWVDEEK